MAVKSLTDVLELTKYNEVDMPESLNVLSENMEKIDDYAGAVNEHIEDIDERITGLRHDVDELQPESITALENKVNTNATNIANLTSETNAIRGRVASAENRLDTIETGQITQDGRLDRLDAEQSVHDARISALGDDIDELQNHVTNYETATDARLETIESDVADLKTEDDTITTQLATDAIELADHEHRISALEDYGIPAVVTDRIDALEAKVAELEAMLVAGINTTSGLGIYSADEPPTP